MRCAPHWPRWWGSQPCCRSGRRTQTLSRWGPTAGGREGRGGERANRGCWATNQNTGNRTEPPTAAGVGTLWARTHHVDDLAVVGECQRVAAGAVGQIAAGGAHHFGGGEAGAAGVAKRVDVAPGRLDDRLRGAGERRAAEQSRAAGLRGSAGTSQGRWWHSVSLGLQAGAGCCRALGPGALLRPAAQAGGESHVPAGGARRTGMVVPVGNGTAVACDQSPSPTTGAVAAGPNNTL